MVRGMGLTVAKDASQNVCSMICSRDCICLVFLHCVFSNSPSEIEYMRKEMVRGMRLTVPKDSRQIAFSLLRCHSYPPCQGPTIQQG